MMIMLIVLEPDTPMALAAACHTAHIGKGEIINSTDNDPSLAQAIKYLPDYSWSPDRESFRY